MHLLLNQHVEAPYDAVLVATKVSIHLSITHQIRYLLPLTHVLLTHPSLDHPTPAHPLNHYITHPLTHPIARSPSHSLTRPLTRSPSHSLTRPLTRSPAERTRASPSPGHSCICCHGACILHFLLLPILPFVIYLPRHVTSSIDHPYRYISLVLLTVAMKTPKSSWRLGSHLCCTNRFP